MKHFTCLLLTSCLLWNCPRAYAQISSTADHCKKIEQQLSSIEQSTSLLKKQVEGFAQQVKHNSTLLQTIQKAHEGISELGSVVADDAAAGCGAIVAIRNATTQEERLALAKHVQELRRAADANMQKASDAFSRASVSRTESRGVWEAALFLQSAIQSAQASLSALPIDACGAGYVQRYEVLSRQLVELTPLLSVNTIGETKAQAESSVKAMEIALEQALRRAETLRVCEDLAQRELAHPLAVRPGASNIAHVLLALASTELPKQNSAGKVSGDEDLYVVARSYFPAVPKSLPEGVKYKDYFRTLSVSQADFQPTHQPVVLHFTPEALQAALRDIGTAGTKVALDVQVHIKDFQNHQDRVLAGTLLLEVLQAYSSYETFIQAYPSDKYAGAKAALLSRVGDQPTKTSLDPNSKRVSPFSFLEFTGPEGAFHNTMQVHDVEVVSSGGPLRAGWTDQDQQRNIGLLHSVFDVVSCFVASAVYESWSAPQLQTLRRFRDQVLLKTATGQWLVNQYDRLGPDWAAVVREIPWLQSALRPCLGVIVWVLDQLYEGDPLLHCSNGRHDL